MKQLVDARLRIFSITSLGKKKKGQAQDDKRLKIVMGIEASGPDLAQFVGGSEKLAQLGALVWDDEGGIAFDVGRMPLGYEIIGGQVEFKYPPLWKDETLEYELVDVKRLYITPKEGRVCKVMLTAIVEPGDGDVEKLYDVVGRDVIFSARWSPRDVARAEAEGQKSMPLPQGEGPAAEEEGFDPLYDKAVAFVVKERRCAASLIQTHLEIGYNRAARILEQMEGTCVVGPAGAGGVRDILVGEDYQIPADDSRKPVNGATPESDDAKPVVPGQKPPQRPKRAGLPAGAH